ncbi:hypothetical protein PsYK624_009780 [Phanerochaete sordida]|uniref:Uncharacterized protein n=1 Tax=Phanerochaete sordida TaxID=48140 RepID=A0A9P3FYL5_9APHY|nr:hypothetical protein PsYK624_009780 [Phanerochaete sordida]
MVATEYRFGQRSNSSSWLCSTRGSTHDIESSGVIDESHRDDRWHKRELDPRASRVAMSSRRPQRVAHYGEGRPCEREAECSSASALIGLARVELPRKDKPRDGKGNHACIPWAWLQYPTLSQQLRSPKI